MDKRLVACELILTAKSLLADKADYKYDPDHKHKPQGGGWEKTEKGGLRIRKRREIEWGVQKNR